MTWQVCNFENIIRIIVQEFETRFRGQQTLACDPGSQKSTCRGSSTTSSADTTCHKFSPLEFRASSAIANSLVNGRSGNLHPIPGSQDSGISTLSRTNADRSFASRKVEKMTISHIMMVLVKMEALGSLKAIATSAEESMRFFLLEISV